jgi:hypothetical protein
MTKLRIFLIKLLAGRSIQVALNIFVNGVIVWDDRFYKVSNNNEEINAGSLELWEEESVEICYSPFESWTTAELAEYLTDKGQQYFYDSFEAALKADRCDLLKECEELYEMTRSDIN